jgi:hypothetical protein
MAHLEMARCDDTDTAAGEMLRGDAVEDDAFRLGPLQQICYFVHCEVWKMGSVLRLCKA